MKELRVWLCGGLGNQLFQYAFARAVSLRASVPLVLDAASMFRRDFLYRRQFELDLFNLPEEVKIVRNPEWMHRLRRRSLEFLNRKQILEQKTLLVEKTPHVLEEDLLSWSPRRRVRVMGFWQSESYFQDHAGLIRQELSFRDSPSEAVRPLLEAVKSSESICVHLRRIQYARTLGNPYYEQALRYLREQMNSPRVFVFSDDPEAAQAFAGRYPDATPVQIPGATHVDEFRLMTACRHYVLANSSFSWWAAWLGEKEGSQTVAPSVDIWDHPDILPKRWHAIPVNRQGEVQP